MNAVYKFPNLRAMTKHMASTQGRKVYIANADAAMKPVSQLFVNVAAVDEKGRVQLAPYGDFLNFDDKGNRVIQRFEKADAENIINEFKSLLNTPGRLLGLPWYIGHPDHARFRNMHTDTRAYGRVKGLEAGEDGLYGNVVFGSTGKTLLDDQAFHGHSVNWKCVPNGRDKGLPVYRPVSLKSVGFTNDPAIPVIPASLANAEDLINAESEPAGADTDAEIPPKLKVLAGFKESDDVTMEQVIAALEKARPVTSSISNENMDKDKKAELTINGKKYSVVIANEESGDLPSVVTKLAEDKTKASQDFANERKARAGLLVDQFVKQGKIVTSDRDAKVEELANSQDFDATLATFEKLTPVIKTAARTADLAGKHAVLNQDVQTRQAKVQQLLNERKEKYPNESYEIAFNAVMDSDEGKSIFVQMQRPETAEARS